ncbi:MAG: hypothetical protein ABJB66_11465 [Gemmatimonadaceae bacterium]
MSNMEQPMMEKMMGSWPTVSTDAAMFMMKKYEAKKLMFGMMGSTGDSDKPVM